jgi:hypothetical protein
MTIPHPGGVAWEGALLLSPGIRVCAVTGRRLPYLERSVHRLFFLLPSIDRAHTKADA